MGFRVGRTMVSCFFSSLIILLSSSSSWYAATAQQFIEVCLTHLKTKLQTCRRLQVYHSKRNTCSFVRLLRVIFVSLYDALLYGLSSQVNLDTDDVLDLTRVQENCDLGTSNGNSSCNLRAAFYYALSGFAGNDVEIFVDVGRDLVLEQREAIQVFG